MGREVRGGFDQQTRDRVVDFGGFDRRQTEADLGDGGDEGFEEVPEGGAILAVSPDVNSRQHNLRMMPGEGGRLGHQLGNGARPVRPARPPPPPPPRRASRRTRRPSFASLSWVTVQEFTTARSAAAGSSTTTTPWSANA